jgi:DNA-binding NtrC family response regulator
MVLIIDDDEAFRHGLAEHLREDGHPVTAYGSPAELPALTTLSAPTLLITDYQMPGEDGLSLARRFHEVYPEVPVLIVTAQWSDYLNRASEAWGFLTMHRKPLDYFEFHKLIHRLAPHPQGN